MKRYMSIHEYCNESGFSEKLMRKLVKTYKGNRFSKRKSDKENSHYVITVPTFENMWDRGEFKEYL